MFVAFRVDASEKIGTGHFSRCLTLANALRRTGATTRFVCRHLTPAQEGIAAAEGHELVRLAVAVPGAAADTAQGYGDWLGTTQDADALGTIAALRDRPHWDWLVVDHYALDERWETRLRVAAGKLMVIDDLGNRPHQCDVLLDQNLQASNDRYASLIPATCHKLIGPHYALLRPEFLEAAATSRPKGAAPRINIFFGGVDLCGMTLRALHAVEMLNPKPAALDVVVGAANPHLGAIREHCLLVKNAELHIQTREIARLFARADLAIGAGGTTSWERCCLGVPSVIMSIAENQRDGGRALAKAGAAVYLGDAESLDEATLSNTIARVLGDRAMLHAMHDNARKMVDGRGTDRVLLHLLRGTATLRPARPDDMERAWEWRNDPATRRYIHDPSPIDLATHRAWWQNSLKSPNRDLMIAHCANMDIGTIRFDYQMTVATISIYIDPNLTGLGLGSTILRTGTAWIKNNRPDVTELRAEVLPMNRSSNRSFAAAGFTWDGEGVWTRSLWSDNMQPSTEEGGHNEN